MKEPIHLSRGLMRACTVSGSAVTELAGNGGEKDHGM